MLDLIIFLILLSCVYFFGSYRERKHYRSIQERERALIALPARTTRTFPTSVEIEKVELVTGHVVVSLDYFKRISASLRNLFGGRVNAYETLIDRARRESLLRMKQEAFAMNATAIYNTRIETSTISGRTQQKQSGAVEVFAYGTAVRHAS